MNKIEFTQTAEETYLELLDDLSRESLDEAISLDEKMTTLLENLKSFKHLCPSSSKFPKFRRCVITKYISLVYEVRKSAITIISIFDTRSNNPFS